MTSASVVDQVEKTVEEFPKAPAVEWNGRWLSYAELWECSAKVAVCLRRSGLRPGGKVGIAAERSALSIPSLLGVWMAGGVTVPVDLQTPAGVLSRLIQESGMRHFICDSQGHARLGQSCAKSPGVAFNAILADGAFPPEDIPAAASIRHQRLEEISGDDLNGFRPRTNSSDDAYIFYTSGSEGKPKGVLGSHRALGHYVRWQKRQFGICRQDRFSQVAPLSFDFSLKEVLVPLASGGCVCIADRGTVLDPVLLIEWGSQRGITVMSLIPTLFRSICRAFPLLDEPLRRSFLAPLRHVLISGDALRWEDVRRWRRQVSAKPQLTNLYGPTESSIIKLFYPISAEVDGKAGVVPLGKPIEDAQVAILDAQGRPCPPGQIGEIHLISDFIANGYADSAGEGQSRFYSAERQGRRVRAFRTGDLGVVGQDGSIGFAGRRDRQVKKGGHRIDLASIEECLARPPEIEDVAVDLVGAQGRQVFCYFVSNSPQFTARHLEEYARQNLMPAFVPDRFVGLRALPLTPNGKVDFGQLAKAVPPLRSAAESEGQGNGKGSLTVLKILEIWRGLLGVDQVTAEDSFFELGGNSILALEALHELRREIDAGISMKDFYDCPSAINLSERIEERFK